MLISDIDEKDESLEKSFLSKHIGKPELGELIHFHEDERINLNLEELNEDKLKLEEKLSSKSSKERIS